MATSKKLTGAKSKDRTLSVGATPVSLLVRQANGEEKKIRVTCGHGLEKPLANYDPVTQSWKMFGDTSLWGDCPLLLNLPPSGMARSGVLFLQPAWEPITAETALSSWPTPTTQDHIERKSTQQKTGSMNSVGLGDAVRMWPTPKASDAKRGDSPSERNRHTPSLPSAVNLFPTMSANGMGNTGSRQMLDKKIADGSITEEDKKGMSAGNGGKLNPTWVEWLMGFPLGWTDLEA